MHASSIIIPLLFFVALTSSSTDDMDAKALSASIAKFSAKFCNELDKSKSAVSSPLSAEFVLALLALGTSDPAHKELLTALGIPNDDAIRSSFSALSSKLKSTKGVTLNVANKVYVNDAGTELEPKLESDAVKVFDAGIEKVNFSNGAAAANLINNWVESKTNKKITNLLSPDCLNADTRLVLVNALYFKGSWSKKFDVEATSDQPFHVSAKSTIQVPMMYREDDYKYGESEALNAQLLEMPYEGGQASMVIVLPKEVEGLNGVLKKLADGHDLMGELQKMFKTKVHVSVPKFKIETEIDLNALLPKLGIKAIFDRGNSGLDKILKNKKESLYVSKAVQKAFIEVNEEGAEAAAATAMAVMMCCAIMNEPPVPRFTADRPFLAVIFADGAPHFVATHRGV